MFESHPAFEERIKALLAKENITPVLEVSQIVEIIEDYIFTIVLNKILIDNITVDEAYSYLERFIDTFCKGIEAKT